MGDRTKGLDVDQDLEFQRRDWVFERVGWVFIALVVVASLLGVFGHGPLSRATQRTADGSLGAQYHRFERRGAPSEFTLILARAAVSDSTVSVWIASDYLDGVRVEEIVPEPVREVPFRDRTVFELPVREDSARVSFYFMPERIGSRSLQLGVAGRETLRLSQFVYP